MIVLKNILVATDFGDAAEVALTYGRELARNFGATLHVVHVVDDLASRMVGYPDYGPNLVRLQSEVVASARTRLEALLSDEDRRVLHAKAVLFESQSPARTILEYAREEHIDAVVIGTHGRGKIAQLFMGSVAEKVCRYAPCPVLTVRHPEHEFVLPDALQIVTHA